MMQAVGTQQFGTLAQFLPLISTQRADLPEASTALEPASYNLAILEGNASLARLLATGFSAESVGVKILINSQDAMQRMGDQAFDLLILDLDLQGVDGLALLAGLQTMQPGMRILVLSGRAGVERAVEALNHGADDYLLKPFSLLEMIARVRALRRRSAEVAPPPKLPGVKFVLHRDQSRVACNGKSIDLTPREFELLDFMMAHPGTTLSRATLSQRVWNMPAESSTNIVDVYVKYLRDKLEDAYQAKLIRTVRGVGYVFQPQA